MGELVSVIIPVYNRQQYIAECLASVQAQTYKDLEIILIDDGSTDDSLKICRALAEKEPRIRLLEANHGGVSAARNMGLDAAKGEYLFFLDSDDVIYPRLLQVLVENMQRTGAAMGGTLCANISEKNWEKVREKVCTDQDTNTAEYKKYEETLHAVFTQQTPLNMLGGTMVRRAWAADTKFRTDLHIGEDFYYLYENLIKGADAVFLQKPWYYGRLHDTNSSWDWSFSGFMTRFYRRQLVWENEEASGRMEYANLQKRQMLDIYIQFFGIKDIAKEDQKKMRELMKKQSKVFLPAFGLKAKVLYTVTVYMPFLKAPVLWLLRKK